MSSDRRERLMLVALALIAIALAVIWLQRHSF